MENSAYILTSAKKSLRRRLEVVANNIANMNTPAFKSDKALFKQVISQEQAGRPEFYVDNQGTYIDFGEGVMTPTSNQFDVALGGDGFLVVDTPLGERYTRSGRLQLNLDRQLMNVDGHMVQGQGGGAIVIPQNTSQILINKDGSITADGQNIGRLRVVNFENPLALRKTVGNLFNTSQEATEVVNPQVKQGMLEGSNVKAISEVTEMNGILRAYKNLSKVESAEDDRIKKMIQAYTRS